MANLDITAMSAALKEYYHGQKVTDLVFKKNPFFAMVKKNTKCGGKVIPVPVQYGASQGRSTVFATAQANQTAAALAEFMLTRKSDYSVATISNEAIEATKGDAEAFINASKLLIDAAFKSITLSAASSLFRSGTGTIGKGTSGTNAAGGATAAASGVLALADATQALQFEVGMALKAATGDGSGIRATPLYVIAVDRSLGTITLSNTPGGSVYDFTSASWAATDYLSVEGDYNAKMSGLGAWLPIVRPTSADNFYGVNRSFDADRLAGIYHDGSADSIEEALVDISAKTAERGGSPGKAFMSYTSFRSLVKSLGSKVQYVDLESDAGVGFRGVRIHGDDGNIDVIPDRNCPPQLAYLLDMDTWTLDSVGEVPHIVTYGKEGLEMLRVSNADAAEVRIAYYANLECNAPGWNGVCKLGV